jgi:hypothetical protein
LAVFVALLIWMRQVTFSGHARLLLPAAPAIAILIAFGWRALWPQSLQRTSVALACVAFASLPLLPIPAFMHDFETPRALDAQTPVGRVLGARYDEGMRIVGVDFPNGATLWPGASLPVTLYLQTEGVVNGDYTMFVHLVDAAGMPLVKLDGVPYAGRHPTRQWRSGELFADPYSLTLPAEVTVNPGLGTLIAGFYPMGQPDQPLTALDGNHAAIGKQVALGRVRIVPVPPRVEPLKPAQAEWANGIRLISATIEPRDRHMRVNLAWQATEPLDQDLTVFVHLLDAGGQLVAQQDQPPQGGNLPTSVWRPGEIVRDTIDVALPPAAAERWMKIVVGFYDPNSLQRAKLASSDADTVVINQRE